MGCEEVFFKRPTFSDRKTKRGLFRKNLSHSKSNKMKQQDFHCSIAAMVSPKEAFDSINQVSAWWAKNFEGSSQQSGDEFTVRFGPTFVQFKVAESLAGKKSVWEVIDCNLHWIEDKTEWTGTRIVWEVTPTADGGSKIDFTHVGLVPEAECYSTCEPGWNQHVKVSLLNLMTKKKGLPV